MNSGLNDRMKLACFFCTTPARLAVQGGANENEKTPLAPIRSLKKNKVFFYFERIQTKKALNGLNFIKFSMVLNKTAPYCILTHVEYN